MEIVIVEDEVAAYKHMQRLIRNSRDNSLSVLAWIKSVEELQEWLSHNVEPDLLLLDIQLSDGLIFDLFANVSLNCPIVFTTAYERYAVKAFDYNALSYLLKPISQRQFDDMVEKVKTNTSIYRVNSSINKLLSTLGSNDDTDFRKRFLLRKNGRYFVVQTTNISYICINPSVILETLDGDRYILGNTLDELMNQLDPSKFFRCNRQIIVNVDAIDSVVPYFKNSLLLILRTKTDFEIIISKDKVKAFKVWMDR